MATAADTKPNMQAEPELNLLAGTDTFQEPLWKSLFQELDDFFLPQEAASAQAGV